MAGRGFARDFVGDFVVVDFVGLVVLVVLAGSDGEQDAGLAGGGELDAAEVLVGALLVGADVLVGTLLLGVLLDVGAGELLVGHGVAVDVLPSHSAPAAPVQTTTPMMPTLSTSPPAEPTTFTERRSRARISPLAQVAVRLPRHHAAGTSDTFCRKGRSLRRVFRRLSSFV